MESISIILHHFFNYYYYLFVFSQFEWNPSKSILTNTIRLSILSIPDEIRRSHFAYVLIECFENDHHVLTGESVVIHWFNAINQNDLSKTVLFGGFFPPTNQSYWAIFVSVYNPYLMKSLSKDWIWSRSQFVFVLTEGFQESGLSADKTFQIYLNFIVRICFQKHPVLINHRLWVIGSKLNHKIKI